MNIILKNGHEFNRDLWYYLAGPMTGLPEYNYPAFEKAVAALEEQNIKVRSPHTINHEQHEYKLGYSGMCCVAMVTEYDEQGIPYGADCAESPDHPIHNLERGALPYQTYLKAGFRMLLNCGGIILLNGWTQSRGSRHELYVARTLGYPVYTLGEGYIIELKGDEI